MATLDERAQRRILAVLFAGVLISAMDISIVGPALPAIQQYFGLDDRAGARTFTLYVLFNVVGTPLLAKLSDRYGRRPVFTAAVAVFGAASVLTAIAPSFGALLVGRSIQGFAASGILPVATAVIGDTFPVERRGWGLGLLGVVYGLAFLIGPIMGGVLLMVGGWRTLFLLAPPMAALVVLASLRVLPQSERTPPPPFDLAGLLTLGLSLAAMTTALNHLKTQQLADSLASRSVAPLLVGAAILVPVFWALEKRAADPILRPDRLSRPQVRLACLFAACAGFGEAGVVFLPAFAMAGMGLDKATASFHLLSVVLAVGVGAPIAGRALDRYGSRAVIIGGLVLTATGLGGLARFGHQLAGFHGAGVLLGFGLTTLLGPPIRYILLHEFGAGERAASQAAFAVFASAGRLASAALLGAIASSEGGGVEGFRAGYSTLAAAPAVMVLFALALRGREQERAEMQEQPLAS